MDEETPEALDDLRRRRLAFFETQTSSSNDTGLSGGSLPHKHGEVRDQAMCVSQDAPNVLNPGAAAPDYNHEQNVGNKFHIKDRPDVCATQSADTSNKSSQHLYQTTTAMKHDETLSTDPLKTSSFYFSNPSNATSSASAPKANTVIQQHTQSVPHPRSDHKSVDALKVLGDNKSSGQDDGYNETVERLIRATKEELLGLKSSDDIWSNIRKTSLSGSTSALDAKTEETRVKSSVKERDAQPTSDNRVGHQHRANCESETHQYLSASMNSGNKSAILNKPKLFSQTSVPAGVKYQNFDMYPAPSSLEPFQPKPQTMNQDMQQNLNTNPVEELFSSRQMSRSVAVPQYSGNVGASQELEATVQLPSQLQKSADFADLGLSTHRPESDVNRDSVMVEADDINLGDTVTQELRLLLGDEKFQQFLTKSKRDIDDLHQSDVSDGSARRDKTPRLLKDKPALPKKPSTPTSDRKPFKPKLDRTSKTPYRQKDHTVIDARDKNKVKVSKENKENTTRNLPDSTPGYSERDPVNNVHEKFVSNQTESDKSPPSASIQTKSKLLEHKGDPATPSPKPVPELNLEELHNESPRPRLNRPKHEPPTIYSEKPKADRSEQDHVSNSSDGKQSPASRNYEQVTVPRNVAFSANEIYHQAYGVYFANQSTNVPMSPSFPGPGQIPPYYSQTGAPVTPKTPTGAIAIPDAPGYNQYYMGNKPPGQPSYPAMPGMSYQGMPQTPVTPHDQRPPTQSHREDAANLNTHHVPATPEMSQIPASQPNAVPPYMYSQYGQMQMMPDFRGYPPGMTPPTAVSMATPPGIGPAPAMTPPPGIMSPQFPGPMMSAEPPARFPHPPVSGAASQQFNQSGMSQQFNQSGMSQQFHHSIMSVDQSMHVPHPPGFTAEQAGWGTGGEWPVSSQQFSQSAVSMSYTGSPGVPGSQGVPVGYPYPYPVMMPPPHTSWEPPYTPTSEPPQTPQTSHAEVQTEEKTSPDDKVTLVEESTFTSVSQIKVDEEVMVPHPPTSKKGKRSSPRKPPKVIQARQTTKTQRHIEGIRQHHEQRRQRQEDGKMSEEQIIEKQKKFAKQSLERYFSSLENLYVPSGKVPHSASGEVQHFDDDSENDDNDHVPTGKINHGSGMKTKSVNSFEDDSENEENFVSSGKINHGSGMKKKPVNRFEDDSENEENFVSSGKINHGSGIKTKPVHRFEDDSESEENNFVPSGKINHGSSIKTKPVHHFEDDSEIEENDLVNHGPSIDTKPANHFENDSENEDNDFVPFGKIIPSPSIKAKSVNRFDKYPENEINDYEPIDKMMHDPSIMTKPLNHFEHENEEHDFVPFGKIMPSPISKTIPVNRVESHAGIKTLIAPNKDVSERKFKESVDVVEDVLSEANLPERDNFNLIVPGFIDFGEYGKQRGLPEEPLKLKLGAAVKEDKNETDSNGDNDGETLVNSARTGVSIKAGGLTERLNEIGVEAHSIDEGSKDEHASFESAGKKHEEKKGKVLIVCPDCKGLNKKYMSWCSHCGEIIIGVEPMLVSKNKQGKIRMKPLTNIDIEQKDEKETVHIAVKDDQEPKHSTHTEPEEEDEPEKPFSLNLDVIKSPSKESNDCENASPSKSDGKDSGRPSSEDNDLQNSKIEQEVVDAICETITDPTLKGYLKSHFAKKSQSVLDKSQGKTKLFGSLLSTNEENESSEDNIVVERLEEECVKGKGCVNTNQTASEKVCVDKNGAGHLDNLVLPRNSENNTHTDSAIPVSNVSNAHYQEVDLTPSKTLHDTPMDHVVTNKSAYTEEADFMAHPPIPNFSVAVPKPHGDPNELRLKLPANSMDFSEDFSQTESINFDKNNAEEKRKAEKRRKEREERRQERRKNRGHGAIDVEVFGYEETRESRNSSRGLRLVPILNLVGNSSDEDDMSVQSDTKPDLKPDSKWSADQGPQHPGNAWEPIPECPEVMPEVNMAEVAQGRPVIGPAGDGSNAKVKEGSYLSENPQLEPVPGTSNGSVPVQDGAQQGDEFNENWNKLFDPQSPELEIPEDPDDTDIPELDQPFLAQVISQSSPKKSKRRPISARTKTVKSKVRKSIEEPGYQRRWARSSTAWSSQTHGELNTTASVQSSMDSSRTRPSSAPKARQVDNRAEFSSPSRQPGGKQSRPVSADLYKRKQQKQKKVAKGHGHLTDLDLDPLEDMIEHRLPRPGILERLQERMVSPASTYDKYIQMTPRIEAGTVSKWQCLPDEILLHIFSCLDQSTLTQCAQVCHQFYRVAMDESLWKYITIRKNAQLDDQCLGEVSKRHPISLALIQCFGDKVTAKGLRDLFRECSDSLKELNVGRCSRGALNGDSILLHAAARCHLITHVDTSWCNVTDSGLMAISNCCNRLESLCISGCQAISNDGLETVIKKHGPHLRALELFGCFNIGPRGLRCISNNCINLTSVNLGQCYKLTDSCVAQLSASLGRVETLDLRGLKQIRDNSIRRVVKNCPRLKHLSLANCPNITDVSVLEIATYLTDIRSVDLCGCKNISDSSIRALVNTCTNLRHIDISSTGCTHRSVSMIANFCGQRLESLKINFLSDVTEQSLIKLAKHCHRLKSVHLYGCTIRNMDKIHQERPSFTIEM